MGTHQGEEMAERAARRATDVDAANRSNGALGGVPVALPAQQPVRHLYHRIGVGASE